KKFIDEGNKAAGTRVRKAMLELKNKAQDIRKEVQDIKNS
ncbi:MAG: histone H1, partial [Anaerolineae bacterium]|nr:histone H1 [Anaerolineae bacterium]